MRYAQISVLLFTMILILLFFYKSPIEPRKISSTNVQFVEMNDRQPIFRLATLNGRKPWADGDRAQGTVIDSIRLNEKCQRDPSLIVVDIGAFLGDFGLYAAACQCQVYFFEIQPQMIELIDKSIDVNRFSRSRVKIFQRAVSDLPTNSIQRFSLRGGQTSTTEGEQNVSTIRLDDVQWPNSSRIFLLKIDVEGFELNVLRSAENLFRSKRIDHLIFEYTAWWTDRSDQQKLLTYVKENLNATNLYALNRRTADVYGPLDSTKFDEFYSYHQTKHLQTDIYASFNDVDPSIKLQAKPYVFGSSNA